MSCSLIPDELEEIAQNAGVVLARAEGNVGAVVVPLGVATALGVPEGTGALCLERVAFDIYDKPVQVMTAYYCIKDE